MHAVYRNRGKCTLKDYNNYDTTITFGSSALRIHLIRLIKSIQISSSDFFVTDISHYSKTDIFRYKSCNLRCCGCRWVYHPYSRANSTISWWCRYWDIRIHTTSPRRIPRWWRLYFLYTGTTRHEIRTCSHCII